LFSLDQRDKEVKGIENMLRMIEGNQEGRSAFLLELQGKYNDYETSFFDQINTFKKKSILTQSHVGN
jgi:hypothetical protein